MIDAIATEQAALTRLTEEERDARARLSALRAELDGVDQQRDDVVSPPFRTALPTPHSPADKVTLFRLLFRGRDDVFPTRFTSKKTGKAGYAPACRNKFRPGGCDLPQIKCGECPNQAFAPVDDGAGNTQPRRAVATSPPIADSALLSAELVKHGRLKVYGGFPHGAFTIHADVITPVT